MIMVETETMRGRDMLMMWIFGTMIGKERDVIPRSASKQTVYCMYVNTT
jgi:hypothetical protein